MKTCLLIISLILAIPAMSQVLIHAHNDYQKPQPLVNALNNKVFSVEADVYLRGNDLLVAHMPTEIDAAKTLENMYLQPMMNMMKQHHGHISADTSYRVALVIDLKEKGEEVIGRLIQLLEPQRHYFDRSTNPAAIQIILSGDRGAVNKWAQYPSYIYFDGRPYESYDPPTLSKVAEISDTYVKYIDQKAPSDTSRLKKLIGQVHTMGKPLRLWAAPDNEQGWAQLHQWGVDIINTDKVTECRNFFQGK